MERTQSPIDDPLFTLFRRLNMHAGLLTVVARNLDESAEALSQKLKANPETRFIKGFGLSVPVSDISQWPPGLERRHYATGGFDALDETYVDAMRKALARESAWAVSQGYEAFERFLLDTAGLFLHANQSRADPAALNKFAKSKSAEGLVRTHVDYWTAFIRCQYRGKQNREILGLIRGLASQLEAWERTNACKVPIEEWYEVVSEVRHAVTHSDQVIETRRTSARLTTSRKGLLESSFPGTWAAKGYVLNLAAKSAHEALERFAEYAFLIFKALCVEAGYDWNVFGNLTATSGAYPSGN